MVSRTAIGLIPGTAVWLGTSDFAALTGARFGEAALELAALPECALLAELAAGLLLAVPSGGFEPGVAPVAAFAAELVAGLVAAAELLVDLAVVFVVAGVAGALGAGVLVGLAAVGVGLIGEFGGATGFGVWAFLGAVASAEEWLGATGLVAAGFDAGG